MDTRQRRQIESAIDLKETIWKLLEQWKAVLIIALLMALLISGVKYLKDNNNYLAKKKVVDAEKQSGISREQRIEELLSALSDDEKNTVEYIIGQNEWIEKEKAYLKTSILAQTDPMNQRVLRLIYDLECENKEDIPLLSQIYSTHSYNENVINAIKPFIASEADDDRIRELFYSDQTEEGAESYSVADSDALIINLVLPESSDEKAIEKAITDAFANYSNSIKSEYPHTIKLADSEVVHIYHKGNVELMIRIFSDIDRIETNLKNKQNTLSDAQKSAIDKILSLKKHDQNDEGLVEDAMHIDSQEKPSWSKKYMFMGFIFGALLYSLIYLCLLIMRGRVNSAADAEHYIGARLLGEVSYEAERKGLRGLLRSDIIDGIRNHSHSNSDSQIEKIKESLEATCKHAEIKSITFFNLTNSRDDKISIILDELLKCNTKAQLFEIADEIDEECLLDITDAVFIVGKETTIKKLEKILRLCDEYDIKIRSEVFIERR